MSLDVGVVSIKYLKEPPPPVYGFLRDLRANPYMGMGDDPFDDDLQWGGSWDGNSLYEFNRGGLRKRANSWAKQTNAGVADKRVLRNWINALPWQDETIMLHLG